jgi:hypothetical protein
MDNNHVEINDAWLTEQMVDWASPIGRYIAELGEQLHATARSLAPVSKTGSRYAPPGFLKSRVTAVESHSADGSILFLVGVPKDARGSRYPLPFISNAAGRTRNANKWGRYGYRKADSLFLTTALETATSLFAPPTGLF